MRVVSLLMIFRLTLQLGVYHVESSWPWFVSSESRVRERSDKSELRAEIKAIQLDEYIMYLKWSVTEMSI